MDGGVAAALLQRGDQRLGAGEIAEAERQVDVAPVGDGAVDEQHRHAGGSARRRVASARGRDRAA